MAVVSITVAGRASVCSASQRVDAQFSYGFSTCCYYNGAIEAWQWQSGHERSTALRRDVLWGLTVWKAYLSIRHADLSRNLSRVQFLECLVGRLLALGTFPPKRVIWRSSRMSEDKRMRLFRWAEGHAG
jgi:hypothetical protein